MKYLKTYEVLNQDELQIGDYVICEELYDSTDEDSTTVFNITYSNVGKYIKHIDNTEYCYLIKYDKSIIPNHLKMFFSHDGSTCHRKMSREEIKYYSKNKKELEDMIDVLNQTNKYNL